MNKKISIIAHRGAKGMAPENTLTAATLAHSQSADMWELDVGLSRDGVPMILHDDSLLRTTNVAARLDFVHRHPWLMEDFSLSELRTLDAGVWFAPEFTGEPLPTLEEALRLSASLNFPVNVELKHYLGSGEDPRPLVENSLSIIARLDMAELILISSFSHECLHLTRQAAPHLKLAVLDENGDLDGLTAACRELAAVAAHPWGDLTTPEDIARLRDAGLAVNVWTVNTPEDARRFADAGAAGLITDYPLQCREWLA